MYFKVVLECGHVGTGKSFEMVRYFEADDAVTLYNRLKHYPAMKAKKCGVDIDMIRVATKEEYNAGCKKDRMDCYDMRQHVRSQPRMPATATLSEFQDSSFLLAKIIDYSAGGICLKHNGKDIAFKSRVYIEDRPVGLSKREAVAVWSGNSNQAGTFKSSFQ